MYQFKIRKQEDGGYRFELGGIKILLDDYNISDNKHELKSPDKAIAYFKIEDSIYGVSNEPWNFRTAEELFDAINKQYNIFTGHGPHTA